MLADLRLALRALRKAPGFTAAAVLCLALGIGANTTVFSVVNTLLIRPLPFRDAERVKVLKGATPDGGEDDSFSWPDYRDYGDVGGTMTLAAFTNRTVNLGGVDVPERVDATRVTASLFPMLGLAPQLGRVFRPDEDLDGTVVVLGDALWRRRFNADRNVIGRAVLVNGAPHTVVGVMGPGVRFPEASDLWLPIVPGPAAEARAWQQYQISGRVRDGVSVERADAAAHAVGRRIAQANRDTRAGTFARVLPFRVDVEREVGPIMKIFLGVVGLVLLIACANVANMLLARATARRREIAVRLALGASSWRIVRQLLAESLVLAALGGVLGAVIGSWALGGLVKALPSLLPYWMTFSVDTQVLGYTALASLVAAAVFGLAPALQAAKPELVDALKDGSARGGGAGRRARRPRGAHVVRPIALSLVLLVGAGLMTRSFLAIQYADLGYAPARALTFETSLQGARSKGDSVAAAAYAALLERLAEVPGVVGVGAVSQLPGECCSTNAIYPEGTNYTVLTAPSPVYTIATPGYFPALGLRLVAGRGISDADRAGTPRVGVINETMARRVWPGVSPLGRRFHDDIKDTGWVTVVGVVHDVMLRTATERARPQVYVPEAQLVARSMSVVLRSAGDPAALAPAVRRAVRAFDRDLPVASLRSMQNLLHERNFQPRIYTVMFAAFAASALLLAAIGLYGVVAYTVAQRTHEIGVRIALGAAPSDVRRLVLGGGVRLAAGGLLVGVPTAYAFARLIHGVLYGVSASDPLTFVVVPAVLVAVALVATWVPARRASRLEPVAALRAE